ncbi:MAG TPA: hypothetical protein VFM12_04530 [Gemmatimonadales bacterium]|nr:hypothetical protein [Gemmatimonadales bacterium]
MSFFFACGAAIATVTVVALQVPGHALDAIWRLNPDAHATFTRMGFWGPVAMLVVAAACGLAAIGLWRLDPWGHRLALGLLTLNLIGDTLNAILRHDPRTLIGLPIAGALIIYLLSSGVRNRFRREKATTP